MEFHLILDASTVFWVGFLDALASLEEPFVTHVTQCTDSCFLKPPNLSSLWTGSQSIWSIWSIHPFICPKCLRHCRNVIFRDPQSLMLWHATSSIRRVEVLQVEVPQISQTFVSDIYQMSESWIRSFLQRIIVLILRLVCVAEAVELRDPDDPSHELLPPPPVSQCLSSWNEKCHNLTGETILPGRILYVLWWNWFNCSRDFLKRTIMPILDWQLTF